MTWSYLQENTKKLVELMKVFGKAAGSRSTKINSTARHLQWRIKKTVPFTIASTRKYSGISLTKKCKI